MKMVEEMLKLRKDRCIIGTAVGWANLILPSLGGSFLHALKLARDIIILLFDLLPKSIAYKI